MPRPGLVASYLWAGWLLSWLLAAAWASRPIARQPRWQRLLHLLLLAAGSLLVFGHPTWAPVTPYPLIPLPAWAGWAGICLIAAGMAYAWWARLHLGRLWSGNVTLKPDHALVRTGPYRFTRHPIYSGLLLALLATALMQNEPAALLGLAVLLAGIILKIRQEEQLLRRHFGPAYDEYRAQVPALLPWPRRSSSLTTA